MEKQLKKKKEILKLVRKFRVKKAKMMNGSVSGQIFQPVENSSGAFLTYLTSHPTRSRLIAEKKTYKQTIFMRIATTLTMTPAGRTKGKGY